MHKADIPFLSATALGALIRQRQVSPVEATEAYLDRINTVDGKLHSYITVCREAALQAAREAEQAIARGNYRGPLHGIPFAVKDQFWTQGVLTTGGSTLLGDFVPEQDASRCQAEGGRGNPAGQAQHERVCHRKQRPSSLWDAA
jgi:Asp-tRNA(Asn)/Glu-tRNA(Gln) amidotransferase A subunit family amidase